MLPDHKSIFSMKMSISLVTAWRLDIIEFAGCFVEIGALRLGGVLPIPRASVYTPDHVGHLTIGT
jgi:hypothetical protein